MLIDERIKGIPVQIMVAHDNSSRIERIISTDPQDYLKKECQPGLIIEYKIY